MMIKSLCKEVELLGFDSFTAIKYIGGKIDGK